LLGRIDLCIELPAVPPEEAAARTTGESSQIIRTRVTPARERQPARQGKSNVQLTNRDIDKDAAPDCGA
jgi:magnesium chelatase family protein